MFAVANLVTATVHANSVNRPKEAKKQTRKDKTRRMDEAFAARLRNVGKLYPAAEHWRVVHLIDNARFPPREPRPSDCGSDLRSRVANTLSWGRA